jgi:L-lactate dehydrogenase complex protein LldF
LRERQFERGLKPRPERWGLAAWLWLAERPGWYALATRLAARALRMLGGRGARIRRLPFGGGWTDGRDLPAPEGRTFRERYVARRRG